MNKCSEISRIFATNEIRKICEILSALSKYPIGVLDLNGSVAASVGLNLEGRENMESETFKTVDGCEIRTGKDGISGIRMPIVIEDCLVGYAYSGQFLLPGTGEKVYKNQIKNTEVLDETELDDRIRFLIHSADLIKEYGYKNLESRKIALELEEIKEQAEILNERFEYATSIGRVGTWDWNLKNGDLVWSSETFRILGFEPFSIVPSYDLFIDRIHPDDRDFLDSNVKAAWNEKKPYSVDCRIIRKDTGEQIICNATGRVEYDKSENPRRMIGTFQDITKRKKTEEENAFLADMLDAAPNEIIIHDESGRMLFANRIASETHGYDPQEFLKINLSELAVPESAAKIGERIASINETGSGLFEVEHLTRDGRSIPFEVSVKKVNWKGSPAMLSIATNISERKKWIGELIAAKETAEENELKFRSAFNSAGIGMCLTDLDGSLIKTNRVLSEIWGYSGEELQNMKFQDITHPDDLNLNVELLKETVEGKRDSFSMVKRYIHKSGKIVFTELNVVLVRNTKDEPLFLVTQVQDITRQKEYENKLERIFLVAPTGIGQVIDRVFVDVNLRFCEMTGYSREELIGRNAIVIYPSEEEYEYVGREKYAQIAKYGTGAVETRFKRKDGKIIDVYLASAPLDTNDNTKGTIFTALDITQRKNDEKLLQQTNADLWKAKEEAEESNRLKTEFLHNMSHEIRTPMNGIMGFSELLNQPGLSDETRKNYSETIRNSGRQLLKTINDILEISNLEKKQDRLIETGFSLNALISDLYSELKPLADEHNIPIYLNNGLQDSRSFIESDKLKLNKILTNVLENAVKFTNDGFIELGYYLEERTLVLYIKDTGIGISSENYEMIFERFSQEDKSLFQSYNGLGLGLAIARENALLLGGRIRVESEKGKGSTFYISIPYRPFKQNDTDVYSASPALSASGGPYTVLIAEDETINYLYLKSLLSRDSAANYNILQAKNGEEAVKICSGNKGVDLVLMDIKMPIMDGYEAAEKIKSEYPALPIIAQTAYTSPEDMESAFSHGCDDFLTKPINENLFFNLVNKYLVK